jgi:hypothetical protein
MIRRHSPLIALTVACLVIMWFPHAIVRFMLWEWAWLAQHRVGVTIGVLSWAFVAFVMCDVFRTLRDLDDAEQRRLDADSDL